MERGCVVCDQPQQGVNFRCNGLVACVVSCAAVGLRHSRAPNSPERRGERPLLHPKWRRGTGERRRPTTRLETPSPLRLAKNLPPKTWRKNAVSRLRKRQHHLQTALLPLQNKFRVQQSAMIEHKNPNVDTGRRCGPYKTKTVSKKCRLPGTTFETWTPHRGADPAKQEKHSTNAFFSAKKNEYTSGTRRTRTGTAGSGGQF